MATIQYDSEFMTNMVAGNAIPPVATPENFGIPGNPKKQFAVIKDEQQRPVVVHLTDEDCPKLMTIQHDEKDVLHLFDLGKACGMPSDAVIQAFDIVQDDSLKLYLSFAWCSRGSHWSSLEVTMPFMPSTVMGCQSSGSQIDLLPCKYDKFPKFALVEQIMMTPPNSTSYYPSILLLHKIKESRPMWREIMTLIWANPNLKGWGRMGDVFGGKFGDIFKILPSTGGSWHGWYILFGADFGRRLLWSAFSEQYPASKEFPKFEQKDTFPPLLREETITTICPLVHEDNARGPGLLLSTPNGLTWFSGLEKRPHWDTFSSNDNLKSCLNLQCTRHENGEISIWFRNRFNEVGYFRVKGNTYFEIQKNRHAPPTLLLPASDSVCVEPLALGEHTSHHWQSLIIADHNGSLTHLQQASDTGHWHQKPFYIYHHEGLHEVDSYTITIRPLQENQSPLINGQVQIRSSSAVTGYLNGRNTTLSPTPQWYETDFEGTLNFIIPTTSMACPTLVITGLKSHTNTQTHLKPTVIDPSKKEGLKDLKMQSGKHLFDQNAKPRDDELKDSFNHLQTLRDAHKKLSPDGDNTSFYTADGSFVPPPGSFFDSIAEGWHYLVRVVHAVEDWAVKAAGDVLKFVAKIGGKVFEFILDTAEKIMHAATWVWNKLKAAVKDLIDLLGHIFSWTDICNTKDTISALITASIGLLAKKAGDAGDSLIDKLDGTANHLRDTPKPSGVHADLFSPNGSDKSLEWLSCNTSVMWVGERLKNGGMADMSRDDVGSLPDHPELTKCWNNTIPHMQKIQPHLNDLTSAMRGSWANKSSISSTEALAPVQSFADNCLDALKAIAAGFLHGIQFLVEQIGKYGNEPISIPVISGLYKTQVGHDLTVFDAISLIIGIVANTITTIITGAPPPIIDGLKEPDNRTQYKSDMPASSSSDKFVDLLADLICGSEKLDQKVLRAFKTVMSGVTVAKLILERIIGTLKWLKRVASESLAETPSVGFEDCFEAVYEGLDTVASFPRATTPKMPGFEIREVICCLNLIKNVAHIFAAWMSSVNKATKALDVSMLVMIVDTGVTVITSSLGILAGALELATPKWKDYNVAISTAGIVKCVFSAAGSVAYFLVYLDPKNLEVSVPCAMVWQATEAGKVYVQCFKWTQELHQA
ncbi:hypothetical protein PENPOL_c003G02676 [Penicillium polonicum]|uniref:Uncharacterized protein n=1 Tax=Penicillium polonicum TaxID=60169 RepID=A0A1V6NSD5_PENPO|nr:hypothetical protein PENPOL_c003G02676 [Penicillium polonicum]